MNTSNSILLNQLKILVGEERKILGQILELLRQVEARNLFLEMGYPSLFEFCIKELGYSEGSAQRRISAMRLIRVLPEVESKIVSGKLSLSVVSQAQSFFNRQAKDEIHLDKTEKLELLSRLENTSSRECERVLLSISPEPVKDDKVRAVTNDLTELKLTVGHEFMDKIEKLKNLLSHSNPDISIKELLELALDQMISKKDPTQAKVKVYDSPPTSAVTKSIRGEVWRRAKSQCCYISPETKQRCSTKRFLEIDHIIPKSRGGGNNIENLQLLCDQHNRHKGSRSPTSHFA